MRLLYSGTFENVPTAKWFYSWFQTGFNLLKKTNVLVGDACWSEDYPNENCCISIQNYQEKSSPKRIIQEILSKRILELDGLQDLWRQIIDKVLDDLPRLREEALKTSQAEMAEVVVFVGPKVSKKVALFG